MCFGIGLARKLASLSLALSNSRLLLISSSLTYLLSLSRFVKLNGLSLSLRICLLIVFTSSLLCSFLAFMSSYNGRKVLAGSGVAWNCFLSSASSSASLSNLSCSACIMLLLFRFGDWDSLTVIKKGLGTVIFGVHSFLSRCFPPFSCSSP